MIGLRDDKPAWGIGEVLRLSWPASLSMLNSTIMRFVDGLMVSYTGPEAMSAQFVSGLAAFVPESFATGLLMVVNTYVSQNLGAGQHRRCGQYAWAGILLALAFCLLIFPLMFLGRPLFSHLNQPPELIGLEAMYFQFMVGAVFLTLTARPLEQFFYGIHRPRIVMAASICSNLCNIVLGYILIFGRSGRIVFLSHPTLAPIGRAMEAMPWLDFAGWGLYGAAVATLISWGLHLSILTTQFFRPSVRREYGTGRPNETRFSQCLDLARIGWPAGVQFLSDVLPWSVMLSVLIGRFGTAHLAASSAAMRWMPLSFMPAVGIGVAATALVGKYVGQGRPDLARRRTHAALLLALSYMGACGVAFWVLREPMVRFFVTVVPSADMTQQQALAMADEIVGIGSWIMVCAAVFQLFDAVGIVFVGALRGAGDTLSPMIATIVLSWGVVVGGGYAMITYVPQWTSVGPWVAGSAYVIIFGVFVAWRFESGKWKNIDLLHRKTGKPTEANP